MSTQTDLFGNRIQLDPHELRAQIFVSEYTRDLCRKFGGATPLKMMEAVEAGLKVLAAILKTEISQEDIDKILQSKDKDEIINILAKTISEYLK